MVHDGLSSTGGDFQVLFGALVFFKGLGCHLFNGELVVEVNHRLPPVSGSLPGAAAKANHSAPINGCIQP